MNRKMFSRWTLLVTALALFSVMLTACGGGSKTLDGTYTAAFSSDDITSNTFHNGFVTAMGANEVNTITFTSDGNYTYTKQLHTEAEDGSVIDPSTGDGTSLLITYTFTGTYTMDGDNAVLNFPTRCEFSEDWGALATMGMFKNTSGTYTWSGSSGSGDIVQCKEDESHIPMDLFTGPYMLDNLTTSESGFSADSCKVTVTPNSSDNTFTYVIVNTDDD